MPFAAARADKIMACVLFALGLAMLIGGYTMDRLEIRDIHPASIPGLLPMILGGAMMLCAALLFSSAGRGEAPDDLADDVADNEAGDTKVDAGAANDKAAEAPSWRALLAATGYCIVYAVVLVGNMPFMLATGIFIAGFTIHFTWDAAKPARDRWIGVAIAVVFAAACAAAVSLLFRYAFLVRLP